MRKISFKGLIITTIILAYLIFSLIFFLIMNNYILVNTTKRFISDNYQSALFAKDLIKEKKEDLSQNATTLVWDEIIFNAVANKIYIKSRRKDTRYRELNLKTKKANKLDFLNILSTIGLKITKSRTMDEKSIQLFDRDLNSLAKTKKLTKNFMDIGNEKYLIDSIRKGYGYGAGIEGIIVEKKDKLFFKGIDRFYIPTQNYAMGLVVVSKELDRFFLENVKRKINRDLIIIKNKSIIMSTLNTDLDKLEKLEFKLYRGAHKNFKKFKLEGEEVGYTFLPIIDYNNEVIAHIGLGFKFSEVNKIYIENIRSFIIINILFSLVLLIVLLIILNKVFIPFDKIVLEVEKIREGKYDEKLNDSNIIEMSLISTNINLLSDAVKEREKSLRELNKNLENEVMKRTSDLRNLLDNSDQGFLSFDSNLLIDGEFSKECMLLFRKDITYKNISNILYKNDLEKREMFEKIIKNIFNEKLEVKRKVFLSLLPKEEIYEEKHLRLKYKLITINNVSKMMMIITDISDRINLENKVEEESNILKMIVRVFTNYAETKDVISEYINYYNKTLNNQLRDQKTGKDVLLEFYRAIHTFKGSFSQLYMNFTAEKLHDLESEIALFFKSKKEILKSDFIDFVSKINFRSFLEKDIEILKSYLGENFIFKEEFVRISKKRLNFLELRIKEILDDEKQNELLEELNKLKYKSFKELLKLYPEYVERVATDLNKLISPLIIEGQDILINPKRYLGLTKSLVHIFRNILDHGIEDTDSRIANNKNEIGLIKCIVELDNMQNIVINISDDGYGLDLDLIRFKVIEKNICSEKKVKIMNDEELIELIFIDEFSTKEVVSNLSGRGMGLSAVKMEVEKLGGKIKVYTRKGLGTRFEIKVPYSEKYFY